MMRNAIIAWAGWGVLLAEFLQYSLDNKRVEQLVADPPGNNGGNKNKNNRNGAKKHMNHNHE